MVDAVTILTYELKAAIILAAFYAFYRLLLYNDTFHKVNRIVLLITAALSFILPLCIITITKTVDAPIETQAGNIMPIVASDAPSNSNIWAWIILCVLVFGIFFILARTIGSALKVIRIIKSGRKEVLEDGTEVIVSSQAKYTFSWMNHIVLSEDDFKSLYKAIILHEKGHIALKHSYDVLFTDILTAFQWFNPMIWMLRNDLRAIHEYEADDYALRDGTNAHEYQLLLIKKAISLSGYSVANGFNHSSLKNRITMMSNKKSSLKALLKVLYVIPIIGISLATSAKTVEVYANPSSIDKVNEKITDTPVSNRVSSTDSVDYFIDGRKVTKEKIEKLNPENIQSVDVDKNGTNNGGKATIIVKTKGNIESSDNVGSMNDVKIIGISSEKIEGDFDYFVDGKKATKEEMDKLNPDNIESLEVDESGSNNGGKATITIRSKGNKVSVHKDGSEDEIKIISVSGEQMKEDVDFIIDGKKATQKDMDNLDPENIESIEVNKSDSNNGGKATITIKIKDK